MLWDRRNKTPNMRQALAGRLIPKTAITLMIAVFFLAKFKNE